jgi:hypothetical protein
MYPRELGHYIRDTLKDKWKEVTCPDHLGGSCLCNSSMGRATGHKDIRFV